MKRILFLDFDGVLHSEQDAPLARLPLLEQYLHAMPELALVISSTWREAYPFERLQGIFSAALRERVIGVTPVLNTRFQNGGRQREVEAFLLERGWQASEVAWVALDDMLSFFDQDCPHLIHVNSRHGFGEAEGRRLLAWYQGV
jgi:hypothetical protein